MEEKKSKSIVLIIVLLLVLLVAGGAIWYLLNQSKPLNVFNKAIDKMAEVFNKEEYSNVSSRYEVSAKLESDLTELKEFKDIVSKTNVVLMSDIDKTKGDIDAKIIVDYDNAEFLNLEGILQEESVYVFVKDIYSKYVEIPLEYFLSDEQINDIKDVLKANISEIAIKEIVKELKKQINDEELKESKETIDIDSKSIKAKKSTLELTEKDVLEKLSNIFKALKENETYLKSISKKEEVIKRFDEIVAMIDEEKEYISDDISIQISIYTNGLFNKFARIDFLMIDSSNKECFKVEISKENDKTFKVKILNAVNSTEIEDLEELSTATVKIEEESKNVSKAIVEMNVPEVGKITVCSKYEVKYNEKINEIDTSKSVIYNNITQEEIQEIYENLENHPLYTIISIMLPQMFNSAQEIGEETNMIDFETSQNNDVSNFILDNSY